jgi:hypothetical protein
MFEKAGSNMEASDPEALILIVASVAHVIIKSMSWHMCAGSFNS